MKVNLRKAAAIQGLIEQKVSSLRFNTQIRLDKFSLVGTVINEAQSELKSQLQASVALYEALLFIRTSYQKVASKVGIPDLLAKQAHLSRMITLYGGLDNKVLVVEDADIIRARVEDLKQPSTSNFARPNEVSISIVPKELFQASHDKIVAMHKELRENSDKLLNLNVTNEIELDEATFNTLQGFDII